MQLSVLVVLTMHILLANGFLFYISLAYAKILSGKFWFVEQTWLFFRFHLRGHNCFSLDNLLMCGGFSQIVGTMFTHHQKCVLVDTQASGNNRKITAFIGGIDLCDGRYDTPGHRLFHDLNTVFQDDFHNPTFPVSDRQIK
jgi:hypothetical protein